MKKIFLILVLSIIVATPVSAGVNDYYFSDFTGDYYLQKDDNGISHLKVLESVLKTWKRTLNAQAKNDIKKA